MYFGESAQQIRVVGGEINSCQQEGIYIGNRAVPSEITIDGTWCWSNGVSGTYAGINAANGNRHTITRCRLGNGGESFQDYGINVGSGCVDVEVSRNHVQAHAGAGPAYLLGTSTAYGCVRLFTGNTIDPAGVSLAYGGLNVVPISYDISTAGTVVPTFECLRVSLNSGITPTNGTWVAGSKIKYTDPVTGGKEGAICLTGGSVGSWSTFGSVT
jgi:hypothetical protein